MQNQQLHPVRVQPRAFQIQAWCRGLGWIVFGFAETRPAALLLARRTRRLAPERWPGLPPRRVRIAERLEDGTLAMELVDPPVYRSPEEIFRLHVTIRGPGGVRLEETISA